MGHKKPTTEEFINRARVQHGERYDYSRTVYVGSKTPIEITCLIHGSFNQSPNDHLSKGAGCPGCGKIKSAQSRSMTLEKFLERAYQVHGGEFDYSKVSYEGYGKPVEIICPKHGSFRQTPINHLTGRGCYRCGRETARKKESLTKEEFVKKAKVAHGNKYDYSKVVYLKADKRVEIICPIHGSFWQHARSHYEGFGCAKCAGVGKPTTDEFIQKSQKVHGDKYKYDKTDYLNSKIKVEITCSEHASFFQTPNDHLGGAGCPSCGHFSTGEEAIAKVLRQWGVSFTRQKRFKECRDKSCLPFDFYFRLHNVTFLVEYDGIQHFESIGIFGGDEALERNKRRDKTRDDFAVKHSFVLIRIPYTQYDHIETILTDEIEKHTGQPIEIITRQQQRRTKAPLFNPARYKQVPLL